MKNLKIFNTVLIIVCCLALSSCDNLFTTSWGKWAARDLADTYSKQETSALLDLIDDSSTINDSDSAKALLVALGEKSDLTSASLEDKEKVLDLVSSNTISMKTISGALEQVSNQTTDADSIIKTIVDSVDTVDTKAAVTLLNDPETLNNADATTLALASVSVLAQVAKQNPEAVQSDTMTTELANVFQGSKTVDEAVASCAGSSATQQEKDELKAAFNAIQVLGTTRKSEVSSITLLGDVKLEDMLK